MPLPSSLSKIVGKPWSAWVSLAGGPSPAECTDTHSRRLNRSEIAVFGSCPASERLTLIPCAHCGDKFKQAALAEHVRTRHGGATKKPVVKAGSPEKKKSPLKKGKHGKLVKEKPALIKEEPLDDEKHVEWSKNDDDNHRSEREISVTSVVPQFMLQASGESVKEVVKSTRDVKSKQKKFKLPDLPAVDSFDKSPSQKREVRDVELSPVREKIKSDACSKKAKIDVIATEDGRTNVVVAVVDAPLSTPEKPVDKKKKTAKTSGRGGRVYDADVHCGVVSKESSRPCTRSLVCKLHSITLRKAVKGRTKPFDVLVSAVHREKELERNKLLLEADVSVKIDVEEKPQSPKEHKTVPSDGSKFSLPVSIKNPNLWSQLQSRKPPDVVEVAKTSQSVASLKKGSKSVKSAKDERRESLKMNIIPRAVHVNGFRKSSGYDGLLPGYRRNNGLLTTSIVAPKFRDGRKPRMNTAIKTSQKSNYLLYLNNTIRNSFPDRHRGDVKYDALKLPERNVVAAMPSVAAQMNPLGLRRDAAVTKPLNLFGPINGTTVLPLGLTPPKTVDSASVDLGSAGLLCDDVVRLESPRTHFFTPSGPLSLGVDRSSTAFKQSRPKLYLPNSSLSASATGIVYLQRTLKTVY